MDFFNQTINSSHFKVILLFQFTSKEMLFFSLHPIVKLCLSSCLICSSNNLTPMSCTKRIDLFFIRSSPYKEEKRYMYMEIEYCSVPFSALFLLCLYTDSMFTWEIRWHQRHRLSCLIVSSMKCNLKRTCLSEYFYDIRSNHDSKYT